MPSPLSPLSDDFAYSKVPETKVPCPRCHKPLTDPQGLGWCQACGYCRSLEENKAKLPVEAPAATSPVLKGMAETGAAVSSLPLWFWLMMLGIVVLSLGTFVLERHYHATLTPFQRALWATAQIGGSVLLLLMNQFIALIIVAPEEGTLSFKDVLLPTRLYSLICGRLPRLAWALLVAVWSVTLIVSALYFVGGLSHWMNYIPSSQPAHQWRR